MSPRPLTVILGRTLSHSPATCLSIPKIPSTIMTTGLLDSEFDTQVSKWMQEFNVPGVSVALVRDTQPAWPEYRTFSAPGYPDINVKVSLQHLEEQL